MPLPPEPVSVRLLFAGDVMQHLPQVMAARKGDGFDYSPVFAALRPRFDQADWVVVNLETTLTRSGDYAGYPCFRSPVALAEALRDAGVDVAVMANNHCCDGGAAGIRTTSEVLDSCGILRTGVFTDSLDRADRHPLWLLDHRDIPIALLNYTYSTNGLPVPQGTAVNFIDTVRMAADIAAARAEGARCVAVCIHWGNEYERQPNTRQRTIARILRQAGADLIIGSHPHVVQTYEADSTHAVFYSLGNFVSNQRQRYCDGGLMAQITLTVHPDGRITYETEAIPVWVALPGYRILPFDAADTMNRPAARATFREDVSNLLNLS
ncbi:MAG: CapA family protein [Alistipes senegalensis]|nr:CapA family protein [Bacteroides cellulosilyticus]MCM1352225.1 CapA family protein [Alistipes senegalensis]